MIFQIFNPFTYVVNNDFRSILSKHLFCVKEIPEFLTWEKQMVPKIRGLYFDEKLGNFKGHCL